MTERAAMRKLMDMVGRSTILFCWKWERRCNDRDIIIVVDVDVFRTVPERSVDVPLPAVIFTKESSKPAAGVCAASIAAEEEFSIRRVNRHYVCRMYRKLK